MQSLSTLNNWIQILVADAKSVIAGTHKRLASCQMMDTMKEIVDSPCHVTVAGFGNLEIQYVDFAVCSSRMIHLTCFILTLIMHVAYHQMYWLSNLICGYYMSCLTFKYLSQLLVIGNFIVISLPGIYSIIKTVCFFKVPLWRWCAAWHDKLTWSVGWKVCKGNQVWQTLRCAF